MTTVRTMRHALGTPDDDVRAYGTTMTCTFTTTVYASAYARRARTRLYDDDARCRPTPDSRCATTVSRRDDDAAAAATSPADDDVTRLRL